MNRLYLLSLLILAGVIAAGVLRPADAETPQADDKLVSIDASLSATFLRSEEEVSVPIHAVGQWGALGELRGRETVVLSDGSLLTGNVPRVSGRQVSLAHDVFDPVDIPRSVVRGVVLQRPASRLAFDRLLIRLARETFEHDTLLLENGDSLSGSLIEATAGPANDPQTTITIEVNGSPIEAPLERIAAVAYRTVANAASSKARFQMGLRKGDLLHVDSVSTVRSSVVLELASGVQLAAPADFLWPDVTYLSGNSAGTVSLVELPPLSYRHLPQLGWQLPLGRGTNVLGGRFRSGGSVHLAGIGMPSSSRVAFQLDGGYRTLAAELAVDGAAGLRGSVEFRVYGRKQGGSLEQLYRSETIRGGQPPVPIEVDVQDIALLVLLVDPADRGEELDYANWLNARLIE